MFDSILKTMGEGFRMVRGWCGRPALEKEARAYMDVHGYRYDSPESLVAMLMRQVKGSPDGAHDRLMPLLIQEREWRKS